MEINPNTEQVEQGDGTLEYFDESVEEKKVYSILNDSGFTSIRMIAKGILWEVRKNEELFAVLKGDNTDVKKFHSIINKFIPSFVQEIDSNTRLQLLNLRVPIECTLEELIAKNPIQSLEVIKRLSVIMSGLQRNQILLCHLQPTLIGVSLESEPILFYPFKLYKAGEKISENYNIDYAAPEITVGDEVSCSSPLYSLGAIVYRVLSGEPLPEDRDIQKIATFIKSIPYGVQLLYEPLQNDPDARFIDIRGIEGPLEDYLCFLKQKKYSLDHFTEVNIGKNPKRKKNQDSVGVGSFESFFNNINHNIAFFCVADGMGGGIQGDLASKTAVQQTWKFLSGAFQELTITEKTNSFLKKAVVKANEEVVNKKTELGAIRESMGTTFTSLLLIDRLLFMAHVGDSRAYWYHEGRLEQLSKDHSYVQSLVDAGQISKEEARTHPDKNLITRSLGEANFAEKFVDGLETEHSVPYIELAGEGYFLLCSDGIWEGLGDKILEESFQKLVVNSVSLKEFSGDITQRALELDGTDNTSLILIHYRFDQ